MNREDFGMWIEWTWKAALIVFIGILLLRLAGRKSVSQMTVAQTVIMISIGSLLIQPVSGKNVWLTFWVGAVLVVSLIIIEVLQLKFDALESFFSGKSVTIIDNGVLNEKNMKKYRFTVDKLEMRLRQQSITRISDVKTATIEPNGQLGVILKEYSQPATKKDIQDIIQLINTKIPTPQVPLQQKTNNGVEDIFEEVSKNGHVLPNPKNLQ
jgi:uncharacterized membrane protein YcaP (DUF421 family)